MDVVSLHGRRTCKRAGWDLGDRSSSKGHRGDADAKATLRTFLSSPGGGGDEVSFVELARQLLADVAQRRRQLNRANIDHRF